MSGAKIRNLHINKIPIHSQSINVNKRQKSKSQKSWRSKRSSTNKKSLSRSKSNYRSSPAIHKNQGLLSKFNTKFNEQLRSSPRTNIEHQGDTSFNHSRGARSSKSRSKSNMSRKRKNVQNQVYSTAYQIDRTVNISVSCD